MTKPHSTDKVYNGLDRDEFESVLGGGEPLPEGYVKDSVVRLHRIFAMMLANRQKLKGPTLDVASGHGIFYRPIKKYLPEMLPYEVTEIKGNNLNIDGQPIACHPFHCDKDRLPIPDKSIGTILFCDVLEHLIIDPMWTLLEFNRVLKDDGHIIISTPNAAAASRIVNILMGINPGSEIEYKPTSLYQRHNREWTPNEIQFALTASGFSDLEFTTHAHLLDEKELEILKLREILHLQAEQKDSMYGPEIFCLGQKKHHFTLDHDLPAIVRWPVAIYPKAEVYHRRPKVFPILIGDDYT